MLQEITADEFIGMMESAQAENEGKQTDGSQSNHDSHEEMLLLKLFYVFPVLRTMFPSVCSSLVIASIDGI